MGRKRGRKGNEIMTETRQIQANHAQDFLHQQEIKVEILARGKEENLIKVSQEMKRRQGSYHQTMTQIIREMMKLKGEMLKMREPAMKIYHQMMTQNFIEMSKPKGMRWKINLIMKNHQKLTNRQKIILYLHLQRRGGNITNFKAGES